MRSRLSCAVCAAALLIWAGTAYGAETAHFLKISPGARPLAMGEAFTAVADDLNALGFNPAGLALLNRKEAAFMHAELFADSRYDFVGYAHPLKSRAGTLGFGIARLSQGSIEGRDENRRPTGSFGASDTALQAAFSRRLAGRKTMLGASFKFLSSSIAGASAQTFALDMGVLTTYQAGKLPVSLGASLLNLGPGMRYLDEKNDLPLAVSFGAGVRVLPNLMLAADFRQRLHASRSQFGLGTEYAVLPAFTLRAGYLAALQQASGDSGGTPARALGGMGMGFGLRLGKASLDYSFVPAGELGNAQRVSLSARF